MSDMSDRIRKEIEEEKRREQIVIRMAQDLKERISSGSSGQDTEIDEIIAQLEELIREAGRILDEVKAQKRVVTKLKSDLLYAGKGVDPIPRFMVGSIETLEEIESIAKNGKNYAQSLFLQVIKFIPERQKSHMATEMEKLGNDFQTVTEKSAKVKKSLNFVKSLSEKVAAKAHKDSGLRDPLDIFRG